MKRYTFAVDWDGTCVESAWPEMGKWLPGAVDALHHLDSIGTVVIHTCRVAPADIDGKTWRSKADVHESVQGILDVLEEVGLGHLEVWTEPWKPSALVYIDDRALRFDNNWYEILDTVDGLVEKGVDYTIGGVTEESHECPLGVDRSAPACKEGCELLAPALPWGTPSHVRAFLTDEVVELAVETDPRVEHIHVIEDFAPDPDVLRRIGGGKSTGSVYPYPNEPTELDVQKAIDVIGEKWNAPEYGQLIDADPLYQEVREASHAGPEKMLEFTTGATRNKKEDEVQYEGFLSPLALRAFGEYMHKHRFTADGSVRSSDNWQKGIPLDSYIDSLWRHVMDLWLIHRGYGPLARESLDEALAGAFFNVQGYMHEAAKARLEEAS